MGDGKMQMCQNQWFGYGRNMEINEDNVYNSSSSSSIGESTISNSNSTCSSSIETMDDASSSPAKCTSASDGALSDLSTLMAQLPIKRGLSEYYEGKSESFTCLARVTSLEDLPKKGTRHSRKMMKCYKSYTLPKPNIFKKASRSSFLSSCYTTRKSNSSIIRSRTPLIPIQRT